MATVYRHEIVLMPTDRRLQIDAKGYVGCGGRIDLDLRHAFADDARAASAPILFALPAHAQSEIEGVVVGAGADLAVVAQIE